MYTTSRPDGAASEAQWLQLEQEVKHPGPLWMAGSPPRPAPPEGHLSSSSGQEGLPFTWVTRLETNKEGSFGGPPNIQLQHTWTQGILGLDRVAWQLEAGLEAGVSGETRVLVLSISWEGPGYHHLLDPISADSSV